MNIKRPLAPKLLNRLDNYLLLNKPEIWSARAHMVVYYGLLFILLLIGIALIIPDDPRTNSYAPEWIGFVSIISIISLVVWLIYLLRFNVFKRYGSTKAIHRLTTFILYFIAVGTIVSFVFVKPYVETYRANKAYTSSEIINDINSINTKIIQLEYDSLDHTWKQDTVIVRNKKPDPYRYDYNQTEVEDIEIAVEDATYSTDTITLTGRTPFRIIDTSELGDLIVKKDSIVKLNDTLYVLYESPEYAFLSPYNTYEYEPLSVLKDIELYRKVVVNFQPVDRDKVRKELKDLTLKYTDKTFTTAYNSDRYENTKRYINKLKLKYSLSYIDNSISNITKRKFGWVNNNFPTVLRFFFYFTLCITMLVFIFRHSTTRTFFLSLLTAFILTTITSLWMAFFSGDEYTFFGFVFFYFILFIVISALIWAQKTRSVVSGISINLLVLMIPFIPLTGVAFYYAQLYRDDYISKYQPYNVAKMYQHFFYAEISGTLLLLLLLGTYIHALYRRWYALPEQ